MSGGRAPRKREQYTTGCSRNASSSRGIASGGYSRSASMMTISSPSDAAIPSRIEAPQPSSVAWRMTRTRGEAARRSSVPSVEALSTKIRASARPSRSTRAWNSSMLSTSLRIGTTMSSARVTGAHGFRTSEARVSRHVEIMPLAHAERGEPGFLSSHLREDRPVVHPPIDHLQIAGGDAAERRELRIEIAREAFRRREAHFHVVGEQHRVDHVVVLEDARRIDRRRRAVHVAVEAAQVSERDVSELRGRAEVDRRAYHLAVVDVEAEGRRQGRQWADTRRKRILAVYHDALVRDRERLDEDDRIVRCEPELGSDPRERSGHDSGLRHEHRDRIVAHSEAEKAAALARFLDHRAEHAEAPAAPAGVLQHLEDPHASQRRHRLAREVVVLCGHGSSRAVHASCRSNARGSTSVMERHRPTMYTS